MSMVGTDNIRKYIISEKLQQAYLARVAGRIGEKASFMKLDRYRHSFEKAAEIIDALDVEPLNWIDIQFHYLDRTVCLKVFNLAYPPPGAMSSAGSLDRFTDWVDEYEDLELLNLDSIRESAYLSSCSMIEMLSFSRGVSDINDPNLKDVIAVHINSGDISPEWVRRQDPDWIKQFVKEYSDTIRPEIMRKLDEDHYYF